MSTAMKSTATSSPSDLVLVGHVLDAQGIRGLVKIKPYSKEPLALFSAPLVWLSKPPALADLARPMVVKTAKEHSGQILLGLEDINDRDQALAIKGMAVYVSRADFPEEEDDSFYWVDLIGLSVINEQGQTLGLVVDLMDNGAQSILCVRLEGQKEDRLIPFIESVIKSVNKDANDPERQIVVDWQLDW
ncbi:ribosome maturation factor RimM [Polynucleobacter cosmopolitanus]|nr:ribosome maturation factor RimM [Polynucleobacter cosmopolitanus]